jgi:predicted ATPase
MKLRKLEIAAFKNLRNFRIEFERTLTTVLLGQNGTGKSNLLEALILIFRGLDLGETPDFKYILDYECRGREIHIDADPARSRSKSQQVRITVRHTPDGAAEIVPYTSVFYEDRERRYLPSYVFGYYSGPSNRMEKHFDKHQDRFYRALLRGEEQPLRPLLYARSVHSQFALLSFFIEEEQPLAEGEQSIRDFLDELLGIRELASVLFIMREPPWTSKEGDPRFWNARGVVAELLANLYEIALAPMRLRVRVTPEFASTRTLEHLYLYLPGIEELKAVYAHYGNQQAFFKALESTYISKILSEVRIRLRRRNADGSLTFRDLSEGEQQLLMVLGLLRFTKEEEALFLLDEPDTHLNPAWGIQYLDFMRRVVGDQPSSQVIMCTHNPLVISSLKREEVRIMQRDHEGRIYVEQPRENPRGMGIAGILTSELFGLRSALDLPTQELLDEQRVLAAKEHLTPQERQRLGTLTSTLDRLGFTTEFDDPDYTAFLKKLIKRKEDEAMRGQVTLTPEQQEERARMIDEIIQELIAEGHW